MTHKACALCVLLNAQAGCRKGVVGETGGRWCWCWPRCLRTGLTCRVLGREHLAIDCGGGSGSVCLLSTTVWTEATDWFQLVVVGFYPVCLHDCSVLNQSFNGYVAASLSLRPVVLVWCVVSMIHVQKNTTTRVFCLFVDIYDLWKYWIL